jgi:hypothetical protein
MSQIGKLFLRHKSQSEKIWIWIVSHCLQPSTTV